VVLLVMASSYPRYMCIIPSTRESFILRLSTAGACLTFSDSSVPCICVCIVSVNNRKRIWYKTVHNRNGLKHSCEHHIPFLVLFPTGKEQSRKPGKEVCPTTRRCRPTTSPTLWSSDASTSRRPVRTLDTTDSEKNLPPLPWRSSSLRFSALR